MKPQRKEHHEAELEETSVSRIKAQNTYNNGTMRHIKYHLVCYKKELIVLAIVAQGVTSL